MLQRSTRKYPERVFPMKGAPVRGVKGCTSTYDQPDDGFFRQRLMKLLLHFCYSTPPSLAVIGLGRGLRQANRITSKLLALLSFSLFSSLFSNITILWGLGCMVTTQGAIDCVTAVHGWHFSLTTTISHLDIFPTHVQGYNTVLQVQLDLWSLNIPIPNSI